MKTKKWHKWLVGVASIASFTGLFTMIDGKIIAKKQNMPAVNNQNQVVKGPAGDIIGTFIHQKKKISEIKSLSANEKAIRAQQLNQLDWSGNAPVYSVPLQSNSGRSDRRTSRS